MDEYDVSGYWRDIRLYRIVRRGRG